MADETPAPLSDAEIAAIAKRAKLAGADLWEIADEDREINGRIGYIGPLSGYDGDALSLSALYDMPLAEFVSHAPQDIHRLLATLAARTSLINEATQALEEAVQIRAENAAMLEIVAAVAKQSGAVTSGDPEWSYCMFGFDYGCDDGPDEEHVTHAPNCPWMRARALLATTEATQTPATGATAGEEGEA